MNHANNIFFVLHLLYEDFKLNQMRDRFESPKLARLLLKLIFNLDPYKKFAYVDYYVKENPSLSEEFSVDLKKFYKGDSVIKANVDIEPVPKLYRWL